MLITIYMVNLYMTYDNPNSIYIITYISLILLTYFHFDNQNMEHYTI